MLTPQLLRGVEGGLRSLERLCPLLGITRGNLTAWVREKVITPTLTGEPGRHRSSWFNFRQALEVARIVAYKRTFKVCSYGMMRVIVRTVEKMSDSELEVLCSTILTDPHLQETYAEIMAKEPMRELVEEEEAYMDEVYRLWGAMGREYGIGQQQEVTGGARDSEVT